jgi:hypothetical protein
MTCPDTSTGILAYDGNGNLTYDGVFTYLL